MQADLEHILENIESAIHDDDIELAQKLTEEFKDSFTSKLEQTQVSNESRAHLKTCLSTFEHLVTVVLEKKSSSAQQLTEFKRNTAKLAKYTQNK